MRKCLWFVIVLIFMSGCTNPENEVVTVFAASSLTDAFGELAAEFEAQNEGVDVQLNLAGSSQLALQLNEGAAADLFASANEQQMGNVVEGGRINEAEVRPFARNRLVVVVPRANEAEIFTIADLAKPEVLVVLAVPGVPVRNYTDQMLSELPVGIISGIYNNVISEEENVRQVLSKVVLGEADAGVVYVSDVTPDVREEVLVIEIPQQLNVVATYPVAPLADGPNPAGGEAFMAYVLSAEGQAILEKWGFGGVEVE